MESAAGEDASILKLFAAGPPASAPGEDYSHG